MSTCDRLEELRDYAFDELSGPARQSIEQHIGGCGACATELDRLRATASALRMLPDREIPQRIAFVSDKIFEPSRVTRWFGNFWTSVGRLGFASACVLAIALVISGWRRPAEIRVIEAPVAASSVNLSNVDVSKQVSDTVEKAMRKAVAQVRQEDAEVMQAALRNNEREYRAQMVTLQENMTVLEKRMNNQTMYSMLEPRDGARFGVPAQ